MNIKQVSVSYVHEQDRFLLLISAGDGGELRLWFTRRLTLGLLPILKRNASDQLRLQAAPAQPAAPVEEQRQRMVENFQKEAAAYSGDYTTPYQGQASVLPLGTEPLLVTEIKLTLLASGPLKLQLFEKVAGQTRNIEVTMDPQLTQGLLHLLTQALKSSQWLELAPGLAEVPGVPEAETPALPDGTDKPKYLN